MSKLSWWFVVFVCALVVSVLIGSSMNCWRFVENSPVAPKSQEAEKEVKKNKGPRAGKETVEEPAKEEKEEGTVVGFWDGTSKNTKGHWVNIKADGTAVDDLKLKYEYEFSENTMELKLIETSEKLSVTYVVAKDYKTLTKNNEKSRTWIKR